MTQTYEGAHPALLTDQHLELAPGKSKAFMWEEHPSAEHSACSPGCLAAQQIWVAAVSLQSIAAVSDTEPLLSVLLADIFPISYFPGSNCVIISANYPLLSLSPGVFASWTVDSSACLDTLLIKPCLHWTGFLRISSHIYSTAKHNVTLGKTILIFHESNTESMLSANCCCLQIWRYDGVRRNS